MIDNVFSNFRQKRKQKKLMAKKAKKSDKQSSKGIFLNQNFYM